MHIPSETIWNVSDANMSFPPSRVNLFNVQSLWKKPCSNSPAITGHRVWLIKPLGCTGHLISRSRTCCNQYSMCKIHILWTCGYMYTHGNEFLSELIHISPYGPWDNPPDPIPWCKGLAEVIMDATLTRLAPLGRDLGTGPPKGAQPIPLAPPVGYPAPRQDMLWKVRPALSDRGRIPGTSDATWWDNWRNAGGQLGDFGLVWVETGNKWKHRYPAMYYKYCLEISQPSLPGICWHWARVQTAAQDAW